MGFDWGLFIYCKIKRSTDEHKSASLLDTTSFLSATKPQLYAFQYIYCNYNKNLITE